MLANERRVTRVVREVSVRLIRPIIAQDGGRVQIHVDPVQANTISLTFDAEAGALSAYRGFPIGAGYLACTLHVGKSRTTSAVRRLTDSTPCIAMLICCQTHSSHLTRRARQVQQPVNVFVRLFGVAIICPVPNSVPESGNRLCGCEVINY